MAKERCGSKDGLIAYRARFWNKDRAFDFSAFFIFMLSL